MNDLENLFSNNERWSSRMVQDDPDFFNRLCRLQVPQYLWIGCSDSRVPANEIVGLLPGELFVHRNVANLVVHTDFNCLSVLQYAVEVLQVRHIIVCGHYGCGGVSAALGQRGEGFVYNWLCHIQDIQRKYHHLFRDLPEAEQEPLLCELNVREQVLHVGQTSILQRAWSTGRPVGIHGLIYSLRTGRLIRLTPGVCSPAELQALRDHAHAPVFRGND